MSTTATRKVEGHTLTVTCDPAMEADGAVLLEQVEQAIREQSGPMHGFWMEHGWVRLEVRAHGSGFQVVQVLDHLTHLERVEDLSDALRTVRLHQEWPRRLGVEPMLFQSADALKGIFGWLDLPGQLFCRVPVVVPGASGWVVASPENPEGPQKQLEVEFDAMWTLLEDARPVFPFLGLPTGFRVLRRGNLVSVSDRTGQTRWSGDCKSAWEL